LQRAKQRIEAVASEYWFTSSLVAQARIILADELHRLDDIALRQMLIDDFIEKDMRLGSSSASGPNDWSSSTPLYLTIIGLFSLIFFWIRAR
jgi:hypothetical protein